METKDQRPMTVPELLSLKRQLEGQVREKCQELVRSFEEECGCGVSDIHVRLVTVGTYDQPHAHLVSDVDVRLELE